MKKMMILVFSLLSFFTFAASAEKTPTKKTTVAKEPLLLEHFNSYSSMKRKQFQHNSHNSHYSHYSQRK